MSDGHDPASNFLHDSTLLQRQILDAIISTFDIYVRPGKSEKVGGPHFGEKANPVDGLQRGKNRHAILLAIDGSALALELADGCVRVHADQESIGLVSRGLEIGHVSGMEDVEAAIGDGKAESLISKTLPPGRQGLHRENLFPKNHALDCDWG